MHTFSNSHYILPSCLDLTIKVKSVELHSPKMPYHFQYLTSRNQIKNLEDVLY
jgi:hypothetical protein